MALTPGKTSHAHTNRLAGETSPYLLQHAHNPVDWRPWGPEALELARSLNKPIFLSVGYSTCYWCHVMERQCFENETIAAEMNKLFVNIKVDREERPDVDQLYMLAVQIMTRQGGWPMSVFLTPDLRPFFGGTYFPPEDSHGRPGFPRLMAAIDNAYRANRAEVDRAAHDMVGAIQRMAELRQPQAATRIDQASIDQFIHRSVADFDTVHGGFGGAPKFPRQTLLELLQTHVARHPSAQFDKMLRVSLDAMAHGGIRDHLGGAFHRYSTDDRWLVPHFEIMLYDNAMLARIYAVAHQQTKDLRYGVIARGILDFFLSEMTSPAGAFYTALDAEVDAHEGASYLWTKTEVLEVLKPHVDTAAIERFCGIYGLNNGPNFADPHQNQGIAKSNVLFLADPFPQGKSALLDPDLQRLRDLLYISRQGRKQPRLDTKILTSWNALMIRALADAGAILGEQRYIRAAEAAAGFLLSHHRDGSGRLLRVSAGQAAKHPAFLDDYAFLIQALLSLEAATKKAEYRTQANALANEMSERFFDAEAGGLFYTDADALDLIIRQKVASDSPLPSGNAIAAMVLLNLGKPESAAEIISAFAGQLEAGAEGMSAMVQAAEQYAADHGLLEVSAIAKAPAIRMPTLQQNAERIVLIQPRWLDRLNLEIHCTIAAGFHINAQKPAPGFIATHLSVSGELAYDVAKITYPPAVSLPVADLSTEGYEGEVAFLVRFTKPLAHGSPVELTLAYQACDSSACLPAITRPILTTAP
ncbi:MAG: DUF255 domain-containing protein [Planctomycetota bacterium]|nr:DUF255 domain-containing protein [Planctomycetota bacterium]